MASAVVVVRGPRIFLVRPSPPSLVTYPLRSGGETAPVDRFPPALIDAIRSLPTDIGVRGGSDEVASDLGTRLSRTVPVAATSELRAARAMLPPWDAREERAFLLSAARTALLLALRTPEEILITLTREEERVERAVGREARASESFLVVADSVLVGYAHEWTGVRRSFERHHARLEELVRAHARSVVPNLSAVVGERAAARRGAAAGGGAALARMRAGRIQLLGTRRRPSPDRGPRYGIIYRADGMAEVPPGRRGAYARSLGAIAAIAIRADAMTHASISKGLVARRDRRIAELGTGR